MICPSTFSPTDTPFNQTLHPLINLAFLVHTYFYGLTVVKCALLTSQWLKERKIFPKTVEGEKAHDAAESIHLKMWGGVVWNVYVFVMSEIVTKNVKNTRNESYCLKRIVGNPRASTSTKCIGNLDPTLVKVAKWFF